MNKILILCFLNISLFAGIFFGDNKSSLSDNDGKNANTKKLKSELHFFILLQKINKVDNYE